MNDRHIETDGHIETNWRTKTDLQIRPMEVSDTETVATLHALLFAEIKESIQTFKQHIARPKAHVLVAYLTSEKKVVGYSLYRSSEEECDLNWLGVSNEFRNKGIGNKLIQATINQAKDLNFKSIICYSRNRFKSSLRLYLKNGFDVVGTFKGLDGDLMIKVRLYL